MTHRGRASCARAGSAAGSTLVRSSGCASAPHPRAAAATGTRNPAAPPRVRAQRAAANAQLQLRSYDTDGRHNSLRMNELRCTAYRGSRGQADWVIVVDADEFLFHPEGLRRPLQRLKDRGVSLPRVGGVEMLCTQPPPGWNPDAPTPLHQQRRFLAVPSPWMSKQVVFHPSIDVNFSPGSHSCAPVAHEVPLLRARRPAFSLLHFNSLGEEYVVAKVRRRAARVPAELRAQGLSVHYFKDEQSVRDVFRRRQRTGVPFRADRLPKYVPCPSERPRRNLVTRVLARARRWLRGPG